MQRTECTGITRVNRVDLERALKRCGELLWQSVRDLLPIVLVVGAFQLLLFRQPLDDVAGLMLGLALVVVGLTLFVAGLDMALFPLGEAMAHAFAKKGNVAWLVAFAFALGFGTTFAEPALIAIADKAGELKATGLDEEARGLARTRFAMTLRGVVAVAVGLALVIGVIRILKGWPVHYLIIGGYLLVMMLTPFVPRAMIGVAYDAGGVTTSTITVPLTTALGVGLASSLRGRNPLLDGFGMIALASLTPILFVLVLGVAWR